VRIALTVGGNASSERSAGTDDQRVTWSNFSSYGSQLVNALSGLQRPTTFSFDNIGEDAARHDR
jgi:hypothetical protein